MTTRDSVRAAAIFLAPAVILMPLVSGAHHSRAEFSLDIEVMEGELVSVNWRNPHPVFELNVSNDDGSQTSWEIQAFGSMYTLSRGGVSGDNFAPGQQVRIAGQVSTRRDQVFLANNFLLPDGTEVILNGGADPYFNESAVAGGQAHWAVTEDEVVDAAAANLGMFRLWSQPHRNAGTTTLEGAISAHLPWNEAALARRAAWNPLDDPDLQCMGKGMPSVMITPHPLRFIEDGTNIRMLAHEYDIERTIYIDNDLPDERPPSTVGYSVGRWEGDTLVVETTDIAWNYFFFGFGLSDAVEVVERITLSEDQSRLDYSAVFTDLENFSEPATIDRYWRALGEIPEPYTCTPG
ncbi:DUF6152 family protein [Candidatus Rariloculus sp.]|uniref:DUF6152 family protein n=1 Tax=Candidatus Rariloculus sp. TaxID=3101265 RepID=UPI003D0F6C94